MRRIATITAGAAGLLAALLLTALAARPGTAQVASMHYDGRQTVALQDGTNVVCLKALGTPNGYYYLPANLRIAQGPDGTPQFLLMKFTTDQAEAKGGISGAVLHFLMEFGLTDAQQQEVETKLRKADPQAKLLGAAPVTQDGDAGSFQITSATLSDTSLTKSLITGGKAPLLPGQRVATAARLTANGAQLLAASLDKSRSITDVSLSCNLAYHTMVQGVKATMHFRGERLKREIDNLTVEYKDTKKGFWFWSKHDYTYNEARQLFKFLEEKGIVEAKIETRVDSEVATKIMESFLQMFINSLSQAQSVSPEDAIREGPEKVDDSDPKAPQVKGRTYNLTRHRFTEIKHVKDMTWSFTAGVPVRETIQLTGNLGSWYGQVRNNPKCVVSVNLSDPFFTHRDVLFVLDLEAKEIFDEAVNYVTVNVRKRRSSGQPFQDSLTLDANRVKQQGVSASITYARGDDKDPDLYEYQAQWSLKGGNLFPREPGWEKGSWEGVTLTPPIRPLTLEVQCDPEELKAKGIVRATVQVRYPQFGKQAEANIALTPVKNEPIVARKLFLDRDKRAYDYRIIFDHKTAGKITRPWVTNVNDDYVYVAVPEDLMAGG